MPKRNTPGPASKTKNQNIKSKRSSFLGESSANEESSAEEAASEPESFRSVDQENEHTDYGFDYTHDTPRISARNTRKSPRQSSAAAANESMSNSNPQTSRDLNLPERNQQTSNTQGKTRFLPKQKNTQNTSSAPSNHRRKQKTPRQREQIMWKQIRTLQSHTGNLMPKAPFGRLIRELLMQHSSEADRITLKALEALQESAEIYLTHLFADAYVCTLHRGRVTLGVHDMRLVRFLRGPTDLGNH